MSLGVTQACLQRAFEGVHLCCPPVELRSNRAGSTFLVLSMYSARLIPPDTLDVAYLHRTCDNARSERGKGTHVCELDVFQFLNVSEADVNFQEATIWCLTRAGLLHMTCRCIFQAYHRNEHDASGPMDGGAAVAPAMHGQAHRSS